MTTGKTTTSPQATTVTTKKVVARPNAPRLGLTKFTPKQTQAMQQAINGALTTQQREAMKTLEGFVDREWLMVGLSGMRYSTEDDAQYDQITPPQIRVKPNKEADASISILERAKTAMLSQASKNAALKQNPNISLETEFHNQIGYKDQENLSAGQDELLQVGARPNAIPGAKNASNSNAYNARNRINALFPGGLTSQEIHEAGEFLKNCQRRHSASAIFAKHNALKYVLAKSVYNTNRPVKAHDDAWNATNDEVEDTFKGKSPLIWKGYADHCWLQPVTLKQCIENEKKRNVIQSVSIPPPPNVSNHQSALVHTLMEVDGYGLSPIHCSAMIDRIDDLPQHFFDNRSLLEVKAATNESKIKQAKNTNIPVMLIDLKGLTPMHFAAHFKARTKNIVARLGKVKTPKNLKKLEKLRNPPASITEGHQLLVWTYLPMVVFETKSFKKTVAAVSNIRPQDWQDVEGAGYRNLTEVVNKYDPNTGIPFNLYASKSTSGAIRDAFTHAKNRTAHEQHLLSQAFKATTTILTGLTPAQQAKFDRRNAKIEYIKNRNLLSLEPESDRDGTESEGSILTQLVVGRLGSPGPLAEMRDIYRTLTNAYAQGDLTSRQKQVFMLHFGEGFELNEIAVALNCSDVNASNRLREADAKVAEVVRKAINAELDRLLTSSSSPYFTQLVKAEMINQNEASTFSVGDFIDLPSFAKTIIESKDALSTFLRDSFFYRTLSLVRNCRGSGSDQLLPKIGFVKQLNKITEHQLIYEKARFKSVKLPKGITDLLAKNPQGDTLSRLNRLLLEEAYPDFISRTPYRQVIRALLGYPFH